jgi:hypothetical protein
MNNMEDKANITPDKVFIFPPDLIFFIEKERAIVPITTLRIEIAKSDNGSKCGNKLII